MNSIFLKLAVAGILLSGLGGCGNEDVGAKDPNVLTTQPILMAALPPQAAPGALVTVQGVGFSIVPNENIVIVDAVSSQALTHDFLDPAPPHSALVDITVPVPPTAQPGLTELVLLVDEQPSNSLPFTVETP